MPQFKTHCDSNSYTVVDVDLLSTWTSRPGTLQASVRAIIVENDSLSARNMNLTVASDGSGSLRDRLIDEAQVMLDASRRMEAIYYGALSRASSMSHQSASAA